MPILDAALAFALTMLVISSVVMKVVDLIRTALRTRTATLKKMLEDYFDNELLGVIKQEAKELAMDPKVAEALKNTADKLINAVPQPIKAKAPDLFDPDVTANFNKADLLKVVDLDKLESVSREDTLKFLRGTELGKKILDLGDEQAKKLFDALDKRFQAVEDRFTDSFRKHSRWWSMGVALVLALCLNIDSIFILDSYIKDETLREGVVAQLDAIVTRYDAEVSQLPAETTEVAPTEEVDAGEQADDSGGGGGGGASAGAVTTLIQETPPDDDAVTKEGLQQAIRDTREQIDVLNTSGFPIGPKFFPHGCWGEDTPNCTARNSGGGWFFWILGILLTGFLGGLGTPFWYDVISGITNIAQRAHAAGKTTRGQ